MRGIVQDSQSTLTSETYMVIYSPKKKGRERYPENCVTAVTDLQEALEKSDPEKNFYAAKVFGPARSSEGFKLYYLVEWLD